MSSFIGIGAAFAAFYYWHAHTRFLADLDPMVRMAILAWLALCAGALLRGLLSGSRFRLPKRERRVTRLGRWVTGRVIDGLIVAALAYPAWTASITLMLAIDVPWEYRFDAAATTAGVTICLMMKAIKTVLSVCLLPVVDHFRQREMGKGGSAKFAGILTEWGMRYAPGMIYLGYSMYDKALKIGSGKDGHGFIIAPNGVGKGIYAIIWQLATWRTSLVCIDIKGQNAAVTAARRGSGSFKVRQWFGQDVHLLDAWGETEKPPVIRPGKVYNWLVSLNWKWSSDLAARLMVARIWLHGYYSVQHRYSRINILDGLDQSQPRYIETLNSIAAAMVIDEGGRYGDYFNSTSRNIIAGLIDLVIKSPEFKVKNLVAIRGLIVTDSYPLGAMKHCGGLAAAAAVQIEKTPKETIAGVKSSVLNHTAFLTPPSVRYVLEESDFSMDDLCNGNTSVYIVIPPHLLAQNTRLLRLLIDAALRAIYDGPQHKPKTLFMLDEAYSLGNLPSLETAMSNVRGYGIKIVNVFHNVSQIQQLYPKNWETFLANAAHVQVLGTNDRATADYFSSRLGRGITWRQDKDGNYYPGPVMPLREQEELGRFTSGREVVLMMGQDPLALKTVPYFRGLHEGLFDDDPYERNKRFRRTLWIMWLRLTARWRRRPER